WLKIGYSAALLLAILVLTMPPHLGAQFRGSGGMPPPPPVRPPINSNAGINGFLGVVGNQFQATITFTGLARGLRGANGANINGATAGGFTRGGINAGGGFNAGCFNIGGIGGVGGFNIGGIGGVGGIGGIGGAGGLNVGGGGFNGNNVLPFLSYPQP